VSIPIVKTIAEVREAVARARAAGHTIGLVPTMGALHEGHAELIRVSKRTRPFVVVSVFVNPTQFGPHEDFSRYPRMLDADRDLAAAAGADLIFAPEVAEMYPEGTLAFVEVPKLQDTLCGHSRPGHFRGVCTVVMKLFQIVQADTAVFGAKDFQQSRIIMKMVRDLNVPVEIQVEPTIRETDGLAMSSRNRYLTPEQRTSAPKIFEALSHIRDRVQKGEHNLEQLEASLNDALKRILGVRVDYARILDAETLQPVSWLNDKPAVAAVAVFMGTTRLIDNILLP
jgi:pantoate--beta-alanine ligase